MLLTTTTDVYGQKTIEYNGWQVHYDGGLSVSQNGKPIIVGAHAEYVIGGQKVSDSQYKKAKIRSRKISDKHGEGMEMTITRTATDRPKMVQRISLYSDYVLTDMQVSSPEGLQIENMTPLATVSNDSTWQLGAQRRVVMIPFDNDAWVRYRSSRTIGDHWRSYEVTSVYNDESREGVVLGAISHDIWKNAVDLEKGGKEVRLVSGIADELTRDHRSHGVVKGTTVSSATFFLGRYADWRKGMETFADANAIVAAPRKWGKAMPVGWNSWGALAFNVNHDNACEVVDYMSDVLRPRSFQDVDGQLYTGLDSGWNNFGEEGLKDYADRCVAQNQVPCIYWTPFTDWAKDPEREVPYSDGLRYKDIYIYANGQPQEFDGAYAVDPTHPAVRKMMEETASLFRRTGYKYVKMDFMTHGRMEADSWYLPEITTGTQAYNYGMHLLDSIFGDMYLNLSISPIFPSEYAQSRRIACDAWNKMKDTEYTMNALSWGWWIDRVYQYNDADHVVLRDATHGENRARVTSSVITGLYITGDDFSVHGDSIAKERAMLYLTNPDINAIATGRSFRPIAGNSDTCESRFVRTEADGTVYFVAFNYGETPLTVALPAAEMGLTLTDYTITSLWDHRDISGSATIDIPSKDVVVVRLQPRK